MPSLKNFLYAVFTVAMCAIPAVANAGINDEESNSNRLTTHDLVSLRTDVRIDWQHEWTDGKTSDSNSGFKGQYFIFRVDGEIIPGLTYSWRQRLNKPHKDASFWDATDWINLDYAFDRYNFTVGKQVVAIGGWEYDRYPIDLYSTSLFWQNIPCFQLGVAGGIRIGNSKINAQVTQSMFHTSSNSNMYGYNLQWVGNYGFYEAMWSANLTEYAPGHYINYLVLGNRFKMGRWSLDLDIFNRAARHQTFFGKDMSVIAELSWRPNDAWRVHGKFTYDVNKSGTDADLVVHNGTELSMAGAGVEFFPLRKRRTTLRLHANCYHSWGHNANAGDVMQDGSTMLDFGVRWYMDLFHVKR